MQPALTSTNHHEIIIFSTYSLLSSEKKAPIIHFTKQPRSRAVEKGKPFSLVCKAISSSGGVSFQWYKDGHTLLEQQKEILDGYVMCWVRAVLGRVTSSEE